MGSLWDKILQQPESARKKIMAVGVVVAMSAIIWIWITLNIRAPEEKKESSKNIEPLAALGKNLREIKEIVKESWNVVSNALPNPEDLPTLKELKPARTDERKVEQTFPGIMELDKNN